MLYTFITCNILGFFPLLHLSVHVDHLPNKLNFVCWAFFCILIPSIKYRLSELKQSTCDACLQGTLNLTLLDKSFLIRINTKGIS